MKKNDIQMDNDTSYTSPNMEIVELAVRLGFATSAISTLSDTTGD